MGAGEVIMFYILIPLAIIPIILFVIAIVEYIVENIVRHFKGEQYIKKGGDTMVNFYIELEGLIDSQELYQKLMCYKVNMLDIGTKTIIQGEMTEYSFLRVIMISRQYGRLTITVNQKPAITTRGGFSML